MQCCSLGVWRVIIHRVPFPSASWIKKETERVIGQDPSVTFIVMKARLENIVSCTMQSQAYYCFLQSLNKPEGKTWLSTLIFFQFVYMAFQSLISAKQVIDIRFSLMHQFDKSVFFPKGGVKGRRRRLSCPINTVLTWKVRCTSP